MKLEHIVVIVADNYIRIVQAVGRRATLETIVILRNRVRITLFILEIYGAGINLIWTDCGLNSLRKLEIQPLSVDGNTRNCI